MYLIDANIFLELLLKQKRSAECQDFLHKVANAEISAIMTDFVVDTIVIQLEFHKVPLVEIRSFLSNLLAIKGLTIHKLSMDEKISATNLMERYKLDFDDALQAQAALSNNISEIVSFDKDLDAVKELKRLTPKEILD